MNAVGKKAALGVGAVSSLWASLREQAALPRGWRRYLVFALLAFLYLYPFMRTVSMVTDEGTLICGATRVAEGQVPSRDFVEGMGPGTFYWLALYFKVFGTTWFATRVSLMLTSLSIAMLLYYLARRLGIVLEVAPTVLFTATSFGLLWPSISHHGDSTLFALLSFAGFVSWLESRQRLLLLLAGTLAGLTTCFIQQKGILLFLSFVVLLWLLCRGEERFWSFLGWLAAGYFGVGTCVLALFWSAGALRDVIYANAIFPFTRYSGANTVPYAMGLLGSYWHRWTIPMNQTLSPWVGYPVAAVLIVPFLFVAGLPLLLAAFAIRHRAVALNRLTAPYWVTGAALWISEIQRKDIWHLVYGSPILIVLCFYLYGRLRNKWNLRAIRLLVACAWFLAIFNFLLVSTARTPIATRHGVVYTYHSDAVFEYLKAHIGPGEEIFAYPFRPMYYFLLDARNATRYSFLYRGMHTEAQFREAVDALETRKIKHVIWDTLFEDPHMAWVFPRGVPPDRIMEPYLIEHYTIVYHNDGIRLLERKN